MYNSRMNGPRIGLCAPDIRTNHSIINAAEKGCQPGQGIGQGKTPANCSGSGGAHGGFGGFGLPHGNVKSCESAAPKSYFHHE